MPSQQAALVDRQPHVDHFHAELAPVLVDFIDALGIEPPQDVLTQAGRYLPYVDQALCEMAIVDADDRNWLLTRVMVFIGEYFAQQYGGCWYIDETPGAAQCGRCVVGRFSRHAHGAQVVDPFQIATAYVDAACPRQLAPLVAAAEAALVGPGRAGMH